ncbi:MAG: hypothetical protein IJW20_07255 [Clostridia bacterium]|nr:hypothetical protein [Clostridia bacterium]
MNRKVIVNIALFFLLIINIILYFNINSYFEIINICFNKDIVLTKEIYTLILIIVALISIFIWLSIKLLVQNKNDEIRGIKFKEDDGTYGTANWMTNEEISNILGVVGYEEYRINSK